MGTEPNVRTKPGVRTWIKVKNKFYWRYELEVEAIKRKVGRRRGSSMGRP